MKNFLSILLCMAMIIPSFGCGKDKSKNEKHTLMVYMVGSDLESKGGSATADLEEIASSGIDLEKTMLWFMRAEAKNGTTNFRYPKKATLFCI